MNEAGSLHNEHTWDRVASGYSSVVTPQFVPFAEESIRLATDRGLAFERAEVLDVGAGPGTLTMLLARRARRVVAVDFSFGMIDALRTRADEERLKNVEAEVMNAMRLTFHESSFDAVFSQFALVFADDVTRALREIRRVLRPGAMAVITTWSRTRPMRVAGAALAAVLPEAPHPEPRPLEDEDSCRATLLDAGFAHSEIVAVNRAFPFASIDAFWTWIEHGTPSFTAIRERLGPDAWHVHREAAKAHLRETYGDGAIELAAEAFVSLARR